MTQLQQAKNNHVTGLMKQVARQEGLNARELLKRVKDGTVVIPANNQRKIKKPCGIGLGLKTKINANIGTSTDKADLGIELKKLDIAVKYGADTVMDLSIGGDLKKIREQILKYSPVPVGTVPIYEIAVKAQADNDDFMSFGKEDVLEVILAQAKQGVDFFTIHSGVTRANVEKLKSRKRIMGIVSRGGAILANWMARHKRENPFFEYYDRILDIAAQFDVAISLGDGLRPGSILDATDPAQLAELKLLGKLAKVARSKGVQVMIEGPGHVPLNEIRKNIELEKKICAGAPFYVLGPLVTDIAAGYDHINGAIGAALAASYGADFLCYVTPAEHLRLPTIEDVREGVVASKIAAHAADIAKNAGSAIKRDREMSIARSKRDWKRQIELSLDPDKARDYRESSRPSMLDVCTMCGKYCSIKLTESCLG